MTPPVDAIREFEVATSTYDASFGRNAGGQINVVTRSGGNQFHGTAYEFFRNGALDGNNFFAPSGQPAPLYRRNQFGGTLGGPLVKDRTFFFVDYEGTRMAAGQTLVTNVPTLPERHGDFSQSNLIAIDPTSGQPFPGNKVPQYYLNPMGVAIAALYPLPNRNVPGADFVSSPSLTDNQNQFDLRLDHSFRQSDNLFARYSFVDDNLFDPFAGSSGDSSVPGYGIQIPSRAQNAALGETHIFTPALLNELRLAFNRVSNGDYQQGQGTSINGQLGLARAFDESARLGIDSDLGEWLLTHRRRSHHSRARNHEHLSDRRQRDLGARPAPGEVRIRPPPFATERLPRYRIARILQFHRSPAGQPAGGVVARRSHGDRRSDGKQSGAPAHPQL